MGGIIPEFTIRQLVDDFNNDIISIPVFQREFVWSDYQIVTLAESIYKGYPIGIVIFYEWGEEGRKQYKVLDGQQRLLSMVIMREGEVETETGKRSLTIWFNVRTEEFKASTYRPGSEWVRLSEVIKSEPEKLVEIASRVSQESGIEVNRVLAKLNRLWMKFNDYKVQVFTIPQDADLDALGEIFVRVNFAGTRVRSADINYTMLAIADENIARLMRSFYHELANGTLPELQGYEWDLDYSVIVRTFLTFLSEGRVRLESMVLRQAEALKRLLRERASKLPEIWELTRNSLLEAIKLLMDDSLLAIKSTSSRFLITQAPLIVMAYYIGRKYFVEGKEIPDSEKLGLMGWFLLASYYRRFSGAPDTRLNEDLRVIVKRGDYKDLAGNLRRQVGELRITMETYRGGGADKQLLLYAALRSQRATDFDDRSVLINGTNASVHHIFPVNIVGGRYSRGKVNDVANITFVLSSTNERLGRQRPANYLRRLPSEVLKAHLIPMGESLWHEEKFEDFLEERRRLIVECINDHLRRAGIVK